MWNIKEEKLVSVITPVYNGEKYLEAMIRSVLASTYKNIELVLVDDGSKDGSRKICAEYGGKDGRIKVLTQKNQGIAAARNTAMKEISGEYFTFVDQDDLLHPRAVELLVEKIQRDGSDLVIGSLGTLYGDRVYPSSVIRERTCEDLREITDHIIKPILLYTDHMEDSYIKEWNVLGCLFKKELADRHGIKFRRIVDYEDDLLFLVDYLCCVNSVSTLGKMLYFWRCNFESESHSYKYIDKFLEKKRCYQEYVKDVAARREVPAEEVERYLVDSGGLLLISFMDSELCHKGIRIREKCRFVREQIAEQKLLEDMEKSGRRKTEREKVYYFFLRHRMYFSALLAGHITLALVDSMLYKKRYIRKNFCLRFEDVNG